MVCKVENTSAVKMGSQPSTDVLINLVNEV